MAEETMRIGKLVDEDASETAAVISGGANQPIIYTNMCGLQFGPEDVMLQFAIRDTNEPNKGIAVGRVYSNLPNMKRLILLLNNSLKEYEELFGEIPVDVIQHITPTGMLRLKEQQEQQEKNSK